MLKCQQRLSVLLLVVLVTGTAPTPNNSTNGEARFIYINTGAPMTIAALLNVPISLALPQLTRRVKYAYRSRQLSPELSPAASDRSPVASDRFPAASERSPTASDRSPTAAERSPTTNDLPATSNLDPKSSDLPLIASDLPTSPELTNSIESDLPDLYDDPHYEDQLAKMNSYFAYLQVWTEGCRTRLLCQLAADPTTYFPASDIFLKQLRPQHGPVEEDPNNRFWVYLEASRAGFSGFGNNNNNNNNDRGTTRGDVCTRLYPTCTINVWDIMNLPALKVWQLLAQVVTISFTDN